MAAGPVSRILSALRQDGHSSGPRITAGLKRPTRRLWRAEPTRTRPKPDSLPIWSCSVWGLPCPPHYCGGGALLPHLFTLTRASRPGRYVFCGTFRRTVPPIKARVPSRTLSGTLLCGVRTFLCLATATVRSGCQPLHYSRDVTDGVVILSRAEGPPFMRAKPRHRPQYPAPPDA